MSCFIVMHNVYLKNDEYKRNIFGLGWHIEHKETLHEAIKDTFDICGSRNSISDYFILEYNFTNDYSYQGTLLDKDIIKIYKYKDLEQYYMLG